MKQFFKDVVKVVLITAVVSSVIVGGIAWYDADLRAELSQVGGSWLANAEHHARVVYRHAYTLQHEWFASAARQLPASPTLTVIHAVPASQCTKFMTIRTSSRVEVRVVHALLGDELFRDRFMKVAIDTVSMVPGVDQASVGMCVGESRHIVVPRAYVYPSRFFGKEPLNVTLTLRSIDTDPVVRDTPYELSGLPNRYWKDDADRSDDFGPHCDHIKHTDQHGVDLFKRDFYHVPKGAVLADVAKDVTRGEAVHISDVRGVLVLQYDNAVCNLPCHQIKHMLYQMREELSLVGGGRCPIGFVAVDGSDGVDLAAAATNRVEVPAHLGHHMSRTAFSFVPREMPSSAPPPPPSEASEAGVDADGNVIMDDLGGMPPRDEAPITMRPEVPYKNSTVITPHALAAFVSQTIGVRCVFPWDPNGGRNLDYEALIAQHLKSEPQRLLDGLPSFTYYHHVVTKYVQATGDTERLDVLRGMRKHVTLLLSTHGLTRVQRAKFSQRAGILRFFTRVHKGANGNAPQDEAAGAPKNDGAATA